MAGKTASDVVRRVGRGRALALRAAAASLTTVALVAPATAAAKESLLSQAKASMAVETASDESHHIIPFRAGTKFTVSCGFRGVNIACSEHTGAEKCVGGRPWYLLSDIFPVIDGKVGESLAYGLTVTSNYCRAH